jgi:two-component system sensor histidine kinase PilS (NtrC family)
VGRADTGGELRWLMVLRVVTVTTLLVSAFGIELLVRPGQTLRPLFSLTAAAYGMVLLYAALSRLLRGSVLLYVQLVGDAALVTGFVAITGGGESPMSFLYLLPVSVAASVLYRDGGLVLAGACWTLYAWLVLAGSGLAALLGVEELPSTLSPTRLGYSLVSHLLAFVLVALLASRLAEMIRSQGKELVERQGAVARLQALNENIVESINSGLVTTDLEGRVNFLNRGACEILGYRPDEVFGLGVETLFDFEPGLLRDIRRHLGTHRRYRFEKWFSGKAGARIFLGIAASNLSDRTGAPLGTIFIFQDLTEIQALEQEVRLKERMAALGGMAAGMAHELRNPLAAISGAVQYLKGNVKPDGETLDLMDIILRESQRLDGTIRDFLTFARPGKFASQPCDLVRLIEDSLKLLRKSREFTSRHAIETAFAAEQVWCEVDPNRMKQVFWNLATNALKAMPHGGTLTIGVAEGEADRVEVVFTDQGKGMDEREVEAYFQPFRGSFDEGTGLGAAIVYRLIEEHGGRIGLETSPGHGTRVRIELPRQGATQGNGSASPPLRAEAAGGRR